jgi:hypothetical protein
MSGWDLVLEHLDGRLWPEDLSEEGQGFAKTQYEKYLDDFGDTVVALDLIAPATSKTARKLPENGRRARQALAHYIAGTSAER